MKKSRQDKIIEIICKYDVETQEELVNRLLEEGVAVTQATVSRDIRELKLSKVATAGGGQKYVALGQDGEQREDKYTRVLQDAFLTVAAAQNILVIKTVSGMAMAAAAALDAMKIPEIVGCIAGDDTIFAAVRSAEEAKELTCKIQKICG